MKTGTLTQAELDILAPYMERIRRSREIMLDTQQTINDMLKLIYPEWDAKVCTFVNGVITDTRNAE